MTSTADRLAHQQQKNEGIGTNERAVKFCKQDYESLRQQCLKRGRLFEDDSFPAERKSLGYNELGPYSSNTRGIVWKRPTVGSHRKEAEAIKTKKVCSVYTKSFPGIDVFYCIN